MKKIINCVILLIVAYFVVNIFITLVTTPHYKDFKNYEIVTAEPKVEITECKSSYTKGYIKGNIRNTTGKLMEVACMKVTLYSEMGNYLDTKYYTIPYFHPQEQKEFEIKYSYKNIGKIKIEVVEENFSEDKIAYIKELVGEDFIPYLEITLLIMNPVIVLTALGL